MKFAIACALAVGSAVAQKTTTNDCFAQEGATLKEECSSLFYNICESYILDADSSCNVMTYSDSMLSWFSSDIYVVNWYFIEGIEPSEEEETEETAEEDFANTEFDEFGNPIEPEEEVYNPCALDSEIPTQYKKDTRMQLYSGLCGFKYQITNTAQNATYTFEVLRDGAAALTTSAALAIAAAALF